MHVFKSLYFEQQFIISTHYELEHSYIFEFTDGILSLTYFIIVFNILSSLFFKLIKKHGFKLKASLAKFYDY